ncbi:hypothetical protein [Luteibacter yeojuensis]|uniref:Uncharacterized protein n=1 Tax=Luteibacter yeojuensis TaxID=345309 RepID=A0A7X5QS13_9GAMM|nr:hypothetical protein [Luteibacter yeojuensis]NID14247.1 hypothetical protein [Luteibacter yeojuensis]
MEEIESPVNRLFGFVVEFAEQMLATSGEFFPFGGSITDTGEIAAAAGMADDGSEHPNAQDVYRRAAQGLASLVSRDDDVAAVVLVANVIIPTELEPVAESGIRVHVEAPGFARMVYIPYDFTGEDQTVRLHEPVAVEIEAEFFD